MTGRLKLANGISAVLSTLSVFLIAAGSGAHAQSQIITSQVIGAPPEASNMKLVGSNDLQARSAYQPTIHHQGDRWIAYIGHHGGTDDIPDPVNPMTGKAEPNGTSIVDVTDPAHPKYLRHIPGQEGKYESGGAQMVRVCDGKQLPKGDKNAVYMLRTFGSEAHEVWNVADPANPTLITRIDGLKDTHKNWWECETGIAFLVSGAPDWRTRRMTQIYDLSDPAHPVKIRDFGTPDNLRFPEISRMPMSAFNGAHTTFPMLKMPIAEFAKDKDGKERDIVMIVDEEILNECAEPRQMVWFADVTVENRPMVISSFTVPEASGAFCDRGGRFGSHSSNESMAPVYYKKMAFIAFFNAGVRALDIRDPYHPTEVGYFIPSITAATDKRCVKIDGKDRCKVAIQTNNVETDERGYIYAVDRANTGLHILELTGPARAVAGLPQ